MFEDVTIKNRAQELLNGFSNVQNDENDDLEKKG